MDQRQTHRGPAGFCAGGKDRADANVIGPVAFRIQGLGQGVGAEPEKIQPVQLLMAGRGG